MTLSAHSRDWLLRRIARADTLPEVRQIRDDLGVDAAEDQTIRQALTRREGEIARGR